MTATARPTGSPTSDLPPRGSLRATVRRLAAAQKGATGAPAYSRFVNRRLGRLLAAVAFHLGLTPNAVTGISALFTFSGIATLALARPSWPVGVCVAALLVVGYALDSADGQLARLRGGGSPAGEWLDHIVDALKIASLHLALLVSLYVHQPVPRGAWLLLPLGFSVVSVVLFFGTLLNDFLRARHGAAPRSAPTTGRPSVARSLLVVPTDYGVLACSFLLLGNPTVFLGAYGALFVATAGYLALASVKWFGEMKGLAS